MKHLSLKIFLVITALFGSVGMGTASDLPPCPSSGYKDNCFGSISVEQGKYVGEWQNGKPNGQGTFTFGPNTEWAGDKYVGEFKDYKRNGKGTYTWAEGEKYVGEFKDGKQHGQGTFKWANGDEYVGRFKDDKQHGQGTSTYASGDKFVGEYKDDKQHGNGTYTWADGGKYVGEFKNSEKNGQGTYTYPNGDKYVGEFSDDKFNGEGIKTYVNGKLEEGIWKDWQFQYAKKLSPPLFVAKTPTEKDDSTAAFSENDLPKCEGSPFAWREPDITETWDNCIGRLIWTQLGETYYLGGWKKGNWHGQGTYYKDFDENEIKEKCTGKTESDPDCSEVLQRKYTGSWANGYRHGYGVQKYWDGNVKEGIWKYDEFQYAKKPSLAVTVAKTCSEALKACTEIQICERSIYYSDGVKAWKVAGKHVAEAKRRGLNCGVIEVAVRPNTAEIDDLRKQLDQANSTLAKFKILVANLHDIYDEKKAELSALKDKNENLRTELSGQNDLLEIERAIAEDTIESLRSQLLAMQTQDTQVEVVATEPASNQSISSVIVQITIPTFDVYNCAFNLEFTNTKSGKSFDVVMYAEGGEGKFTAATKDIEKALSESGLSAGENDWSKLTVKAEKFDDPNVVCQPENQNSYPISKDGADGTFKIDGDGQLTMTGMQIVAASESDPAEIVAKEPVFSESITSIVAQVTNPDFDMKNCSFNLEFTNTASGKSFDVAMDSTEGASGNFTATANDIEDGLADAGLNYEDNQWNRLKVKIKKSDYPFVSCQPEGQTSYKIAKDRSVNTFKIDSDGQLQIMDLPIVTVINSVDVEVAEEEAVPDDWRSKYWQIQANQLFGKDRLEVRRQHYTQTLGISKIEIFKLYQDGNQYVLAFGPFENMDEAYEFFKSNRDEKTASLFPDIYRDERIRYGDDLLDWFKIAEDGSVIFERIDTNNNNTLESVQDDGEANQNDQEIDSLEFQQRKQVQKILRKLSMYQGIIDGDFGPGTKRAIKTFQYFLNENETGFLTVGQFNNLLEYAKP